MLGRVNMVSGHVKTQLIAHDKEVYDIAFSKAGGGRDMFASVGADGSVRMFDLRLITRHRVDWVKLMVLPMIPPLVSTHKQALHA